MATRYLQDCGQLSVGSQPTSPKGSFFLWLTVSPSGRAIS